MKCQHCGSTDIVAIQGQNYCLNCGYAVTAPAPKVAPSWDNGAGQVAPVIAQPTKPSKPLVSGKTTKRGRGAAKALPVAALASEERDIVPSTPARPGRGTASDIRPKASAKRAVTVHPLRFSLMVAVIAAVGCGLVTAGALWFQLDSDSGAFVIVATIIALGVGIGLAHAALLYGRSRSQDGRPTPRSYWWLAARGGFMDIVNVQLVAIISVVVLVGIGVGLWHAVVFGGWQLATPVAAVLLGVANIVLIWALLGVYAASRLATPAVVIGGYSVTEAVGVGWRLYRKAGGHLIAAAIEALLTRVAAAAILAVVGYAAATMVTATGAGAVAIGSGVGAMMIVFVAVILLLEVDTKIWLTQYRHWATLCPPAERIRLLTGRVQSHL